MRIAVDAFGGDNAPLEIIKGAALASNEQKVDITLTGNKQKIEAIIKENGFEFHGELVIIDTDDVIDMHDDPTSLLKAHKESSMALAFKEVCEDRADAFVSAGSTGAIVVGGTLMVKRIKGVKRPALAGFIPAPNGHYMLMDMGANAECRPEMLEQFGIMANAYLKNVEGIENPKIGLLNIGTEDTKGDELRQEAYKLLSKADINFVGNIESAQSGTATANLRVDSNFEGEVKGKITITYEDDYGEVYTDTVDVLTVIEKKVEQIEIKEEPEKNNSLWWLFILIGLALGGGLGFGIPWLINDKKQRKEDDLRL